MSIYRSSASILRRNPGPTVGLVAVLITLIAAMGVVARLPLVGDPRWTPPVDGDVRQVLVNLGFYPVGTILVTLVWMLVSVIVTATGSVAACRHLAGERTSVRQAWGRSRPRIPAAVGLGLLDVVVFLVPIVTAGAIAIALAVRAGPESARVTTTLLLALAGLAIVLVLPSLVLAGPMLVLEGLRPVDALWRSFDLQRRGYWRLVVRVICTYLIVVAVSTVVGLPFSLAASQARPHGDVSAQSLASLILGSVGWVFGQIATLPFLIVTNAQLYTDQLVRCADADTT